MLDAEDADGISVREALQRFGCDPLEIPGLRRRREAVLGYVEVHIEQRPVLGAEALPLGSVTAIDGASRFALEGYRANLVRRREKLPLWR